MKFGNQLKSIHSLRFDPEDKYIAAGFTDGTVRVFNMNNGTTQLSLQANYINEDEKFAFTCLRWCPRLYSSKEGNLLTAVSVDGSIYQWMVPSGKIVTTIKSSIPANDLYSLDYNNEGSKFAVAGKDLNIKLYDESTKELIRELIPDSQKIPGHSNRIFSLKFSEDPNLLLSASWDKTIKVWDLRQNEAIASILGVEISGDSIDSVGDLIFSGSHRSKNSIQVWSLHKYNLIENFNWEESTLIYSLRVSPISGQYLLIGGSNKNEVKIFDRGLKNSFVCGVTDLLHPCFSVDFSHDTKMIAVGCSDGSIQFFEISLEKKSH